MPRYRIDAAQSEVDIGLRVNLHPSHITATGISGEVECELDDQGRPRLDQPYSAELTLPVAAISSGIGLQDREMRRRFDASRYPNITARLVKGEAVSVDEGRYRATATLTMHGQTREVSGEVRLTFSNGTLTAEAPTTINMKNFGIDPPRLIVLKVEPEVDVRAHIVAELE
jgi:polyisoprenoid-binding protein YceI